ncbi:MAG TPA: RIO1 family regulatory kinase/ATPase [Anaerolineales bacterium]|nr:RIO1 family regulatory kinase/ATPase [Anaerolineales bacterium]
MDTDKYIEFFNELDDNEQTNNFIQSDKRRERFPLRNPKKLPEADREFLNRQDDSRSNFKFTYKAARFEEWWLLDSLGDFYEHKWIVDVLKRVKGGKEASVYQCKPGVAVDAPLVAAKVYRPRSLRNLKNDQQYRTGRIDLDEDGTALWKEADVNAVAKRTSYGEEVRHQSWISYEFNTLELLYKAGADVPKPYALEKNAILMGFVGDLGTAAPALSSIRLELDEARPLFDRVIYNIDLMLTQGRIHGDLSAYNILYWDGNITLIDFPQVVLPESNPASWNIFFRDVTRICQYFSAQAVKCDTNKIASDLWTSHGHKIVRQVDPKYLDAERPEDRQIWEKQE